MVVIFFPPFASHTSDKAVRIFGIQDKRTDVKIRNIEVLFQGFPD